MSPPQEDRWLRDGTGKEFDTEYPGEARFIYTFLSIQEEI
jgi:hypothetical protein